MQLSCPHCGGRAMPAWIKLALGPAVERPCDRCGLKVGAAVVPSLVALLPCAVEVLLLWTRVLRGPVLMTASAVLALAFTAALYLAWVPLVRRELTRPEVVAAARREAVRHD